MLRREHELRCFCKSKPLLATYGLNKDGALYLHVKIYKQSRIYGELILLGGLVRIKCRNCLRWHRIRIQGNRAELVNTQEPETLPRADSATVLDV